MIKPMKELLMLGFLTMQWLRRDKTWFLNFVTPSCVLSRFLPSFHSALYSESHVHLFMDFLIYEQISSFWPDHTEAKILVFSLALFFFFPHDSAPGLLTARILKIRLPTLLCGQMDLGPTYTGLCPGQKIRPFLCSLLLSPLFTYVTMLRKSCACFNKVYTVVICGHPMNIVFCIRLWG